MLFKPHQLQRALLVFGLALLVSTPSSAQRRTYDWRDPYAPTLFQTDPSRLTGMVPVDPMSRGRGWQSLTMGVARFGYNNQGGDLGENAWESTNWLMGMLYHRLGPGRISFMLMGSLEAATIDDPGSPQIFQTGGTFDGAPLVNYQRPNDFLMNLSATYRMSIGRHGAAWAQYAAAGEPALGPISYLHRASAGDNPTAPLGYYWQDATQVTYNVATVGFGWKWMSVSASEFYGRAPDDDPWDADWGPMDSYSVRARLGLTTTWSVDASYGDLKDYYGVPGDVQRTTAAVHYGQAGNSPIAFMLLWGRNDGDLGTSDSFLAEYARRFNYRNQLYLRYERVEKSQALLAPDSTFAPNESASINAVTIGLFNEGTMFRGFGMGGDVTLHWIPSDLKPDYGDFPVSFHLFIRARWDIATAGVTRR